MSSLVCVCAKIYVLAIRLFPEMKRKKIRQRALQKLPSYLLTIEFLSSLGNLKEMIEERDAGYIWK